MRILQTPLRSFLSLCAIGWFVIADASAAGPADAIPDSASAVVRWKTPQISLGKLGDFVDAVQPGEGAAVIGSLPGMGDSIGIPELQGVDAEQDIWGVVFAEPETTPVVVFILTATDVDEVKQALEGDFEVYTSGKLVFYSEDKEFLAKVRKQFGGEGKTIWSRIDAASKKLFDASDIAVLINIQQLITDFADDLKNAESQLDGFLEQLTNAIPAPQRAQVAPVFGVYGEIGKAVLRSLKDLNSWTLGLTVTATAIRHEARLQILDGTPTSKFLAAQSSGDLSLINKLPAGKSMYIGVKMDMGRWVEEMMKLSMSILKDPSADQKAQIDAAIKDLAKVKFDEIAMYFDCGAESPAVRIGSISLVDQTSRIRDISQRLVKAMSKLSGPGFTQTMKLETNVAKIGGAEVDRVTTKQVFESNEHDAQFQKKLQSVMFGDSGVQQLCLHQPNRMLQTIGGGVAELQALAKSVDAPKSGDPEVAATRSHYFEKANVIVLIDVARLIVNGVKLAIQEKALPVDAKLFDDLKLEPSFAGMALAGDATSFRSQIEIPLIVAKNIAEVVGQFASAGQ